MKTKHESERNHKIAKEAYEKVYGLQEYENSVLYGTFSKVIDEVIKKVEGK